MNILRSFAIAIVAIILLASNGLAQTYLEYQGIDVLVDYNGDGTLTEAKAYIPLNTPDNEGDFFGTVIKYKPPHGDKKNCIDEKYEYDVVTMNDGWEAVLFVEVEGGYQQYLDPDTGEPFYVTAEDCQRYWDFVYEGYERETELDFKTNCHGFSFDVGDWPASAEGLLGPQIVDPGDPPPPPCCYTSTTDKKKATIAADPKVHSIMVVGAECEDPDPDPEIVLPPGHVHLVPAIVESREQWRESGTYKQTAVCPDSVNLKKGKLHSELDLTLYKKNSD